jgi:site-specific DNA-methyltransferase (adenine-specific)
MNPYHHDEAAGITIYCGDTLQVLAAIVPELAGKVQAIVTDPPYASGARTEAAKATSGAMLRGQRWASKPIENDQMTTTGFIWLMRQTLLLARPTLVDSGNVLSFIDWRQWPNLVGAVETCNLRVNNMVVWDKLSMGLGNGFRAQHELILHASQGTCDPDDRGTGNIIKMAPDPGPWQHEEAGNVLDNPRDSNEFHPSPKPVALMQKLLRVVSSKGDLIVDPFGGAGATAVACKAEGRRCIMIEARPEHCQTAVQRLAQNVMEF